MNFNDTQGKKIHSTTRVQIFKSIETMALSVSIKSRPQKAAKQNMGVKNEKGRRSQMRKGFTIVILRGQ